MDMADPAYKGDGDNRAPRGGSPLDLAWLRRGAGLKSTGMAALNMLAASDPADEAAEMPISVPQLMPRPGMPLPNGTQTFTEFCDMEIARIAARMAAIRADAETAVAQSAEHSARGDTSLALHCDARAKMLTLEEGLLRRALERWERVRSDGHFGARY